MLKREHYLSKITFISFMLYGSDEYFEKSALSTRGLDLSIAAAYALI